MQFPLERRASSKTLPSPEHLHDHASAKTCIWHSGTHHYSKTSMPTISKRPGVSCMLATGAGRGNLDSLQEGHSMLPAKSTAHGGAFLALNIRWRLVIDGWPAALWARNIWALICPKSFPVGGCWGKRLRVKAKIWGSSCWTASTIWSPYSGHGSWTNGMPSSHSTKKVETSFPSEVPDVSSASVQEAVIAFVTAFTIWAG